LNPKGFSLSSTWEHLAEQFPDARDVDPPHLTHFIPMQEPELVTRLIVGPDAEIPFASLPRHDDGAVSSTPER